MVAWCHDFVAVFGVMQDHGAVPYGAVQCNHGAVSYGTMQKRSDCEIFANLVYFVLKFSKRVNYSHFLAKDSVLFPRSLREPEHPVCHFVSKRKMKMPLCL
jgi:hypothetical protein